MDDCLQQNPAYRATLLSIRWAQVETALTFPHFGCTSCYITCRRFECFYGETMGKYGQFDGQFFADFVRGRLKIPYPLTIEKRI
jgi:hypothetical protein